MLKRIGQTKLGAMEELVVREDTAQEEMCDENENSNTEAGNGKQRPLYELVGAAYVHGVMDGEGMDEMSEAANFLLK
jgi:hypothetical protein